MVSLLPNSDFTGRNDTLDLIDKYLLPKAASDSDIVRNPRTFALCGMGGLVKTDIAIHYAYSRRREFGAVFWLEAGGVSQLASDFGRIPSQLGI